MSNQPLGFAELLAGGVLLTAAITGGSVADVISGNATGIKGFDTPTGGPPGPTGPGAIPDSTGGAPAGPAGPGGLSGVVKVPATGFVGSNLRTIQKRAAAQKGIKRLQSLGGGHPVQGGVGGQGKVRLFANPGPGRQNP